MSPKKPKGKVPKKTGKDNTPKNSKKNGETNAPTTPNRTSPRLKKNHAAAARNGPQSPSSTLKSTAKENRNIDTPKSTNNSPGDMVNDTTPGGDTNTTPAQEKENSTSDATSPAQQMKDSTSDATRDQQKKNSTSDATPPQQKKDSTSDATPVQDKKHSTPKAPSPIGKKDNLQDCQTKTVTINNTMLPFLYPLYLDEKGEIVCYITHTNHNNWNVQTQAQIMMTYLHNPYLRPPSEMEGTKSPGNDMEVLLMPPPPDGSEGTTVENTAVGKVRQTLSYLYFIIR